MQTCKLIQSNRIKTNDQHIEIWEEKNSKIIISRQYLVNDKKLLSWTNKKFLKFSPRNFRYLYNHEHTAGEEQLTYVCFQDKARALRLQSILLKYHEACTRINLRMHIFLDIYSPCLWKCIAIYNILS